MRRAAASGRHRRLANHRRVIAIGDDEPGAIIAQAAAVEGREIEAARHRPEEAVAIIEIVGPLAVAHQIGARNLDLDDDQLAFGRKRHHVGAAAIGQRRFAEREHVGAEEHPGDAARDIAGDEREIVEAAVGTRIEGAGHRADLE